MKLRRTVGSPRDCGESYVCDGSRDAPEFGVPPMSPKRPAGEFGSWDAGFDVGVPGASFEKLLRGVQGIASGIGASARCDCRT